MADLLTSLLPIDAAGLATLAWLALGLLGLFIPRRLITAILFPAGAAVALLLAAAGLWGLNTPTQSTVLPLGLPDLPFHLRLDALSAFFLLLLGAAATGISLYAAGYFRSLANKDGTLNLLCLQYHVFLASMAWVLLADDAYLFMVAWETMALSSYFLVTTDHVIPDIRRAGFLYLLIAHIGAIAILLAFGVMQGGHGDYSFAAMRAGHLDAFRASMAFLLALFGFGAKAGLLPLHAWLPEAHPAAPSPVSAMMSGIMLKTAIYGMLRVMFDLLDERLWWWGALMLVLGLSTALFGVLFAAVQTDIKRLLAYSSIENIGIIASGIGLGILFHAYNEDAVAALALTATLYHALNHAFFKSLLFLGAGSVLHATAERNMAKLGGLIHRMPWVAATALIGTLAIAGLPPFNGFVSEWLMLQAYLLTPALPAPYLNMMLPLGAAALALAAALAAYAMVKFYGIIFLGRPRGLDPGAAHDAGAWERLGLTWLAAGCVLLGLFPASVILQLDAVTRLLTGQALGNSAAHSGWLWLTPVAEERASYSPMILLLVIAGGLALTFLAVRKFYHGRLRRGPAWDCGYPQQTARMQDSAEGFGQPIKQIFEQFFGISRELPSPFDAQPHYRGEIRDRLWELFYRPLARLVERISMLVGALQHGRISIYLLYSFVTLIALLAFIR
ncbi:MAG TPA: hydrogenase 4 subunit B [Novimethylophilus sp.]|jgi:formate hydrogenlyase subunit 3/multisubunit Na+/H+ antiporter MnhD subunit|uniref:hydrogenase 4 subunit B n=1 Tax=Novimethylophilus sp. TaxID=2137426 RepID=UPI002F429D9A